MTGPAASRLLLPAAAWLTLWVWPVRITLESDMALHMAVQLPLLIGLGLSLAFILRTGEPRWFADADWLGIPGIVLVVFTTSFWMLPRALDNAIADPWTDAAKFLSLPLLAGLPLGLSWRRMPPLGRAFIWANFIPKLGAVGGLLHRYLLRVEKKMRLTLHTDLSLRVLMQVGLNDGDLTTIEEIARSFDVSKNHLMKVVNDLSQKGYLDTVRGRNGGIRLKHDPSDINIGQVVRDTEDRLDVIGCLEGAGLCRIQRACVLRGILGEATDAFLAVLDRQTLADLIKPRKALLSLLFHAEGRRAV